MDARIASFPEDVDVDDEADAGMLKALYTPLCKIYLEKRSVMSPRLIRSWTCSVPCKCGFGIIARRKYDAAVTPRHAGSQPSLLARACGWHEKATRANKTVSNRMMFDIHQTRRPIEKKSPSDCFVLTLSSLLHFPSCSSSQRLKIAASLFLR